MTSRLTIRMPALSNTMEEGEIIDWKVDVGDTVRTGQPIAEVVTDKVDMELESPYDGTIVELITAPGTAVRVGEPVAEIESEEGDLLGGLELDGEAPAPPEPIEPAVREESRQPSTRQGTVPAPPPIRRRAKDLGIDLAQVTPTGKRGQVTREDLDRFVEERTAAEPAQPAAAPEGAVPATRRVAGGPDRRAAIRAATARLVTKSAAIPQFTLHRRLDLTDARERKQGRGWTTEIVRALAAALREHPELNGQWDETAERVVPNDQVRIGIAVDREDGLIVVCLDDPDLQAPGDSDQALRALVGRAREGDLRPEDARGATFTVSNLGGYGVDHFQALLMPPQAGIMSVGRVVEVPVVIDGWIKPRLCVDVGLTVDHRVGDGADGARLFDDFAQRLEGTPW